MQASFKSTLAALAVGLLGATAAAPAIAQRMVPVTPGTMAYGTYQGPHGHYNSLSDFVRSINGIPCGMACTRAAQMRWSHPYAREDMR